MTEIGIEQARKTLGDIASRAQYAGQITYLTRNGRRVAAIVPLERIMQTTATDNAYVIVIEAASPDGQTWQAVEAAEVVYGYPQHENADDIAGWVVQNQNAATGPGKARVRVWMGDDLDVLHQRPADAERQIPTRQTFLKYTQNGHITVVTEDDHDVADLGHFDADGGTWQDEVKEIARKAGWTPISAWDDAQDDAILVVEPTD